MVSVSRSAGSRSGPSLKINNPFCLLFSSKPWASAAFFVLSFVIGVFWFCVLVSLIATGIGMAITFVGIPILAATMVLWTLGARAERWRIGQFFDVRIASPYRPLPPIREKKWVESWITRVRVFVTDPAVWLDLCYLLLLFPIGIVEFVITVVAVSLPLAMVTMPLYFWAVPGGVELWGNASLGNSGFIVDTLPEALFVSAAGVPMLVLAAFILVGMGRAHLVFARALLGRNREEELEARVGELTVSRSRVMEATLAERRRIERDLHDGAQQRLVALAMDLGMAKIKMDSDPDAARRLVDEAHKEAKLALVEIRHLVMGIHPAVLTDRGLDAAVSGLASRCPIPVAVNVELDHRLSDAVESTAYFIVAEALTNVAKHSVANEAWITIHREGNRLVVEVGDNGLGGADPMSGSGLAGLADRVVALDGRFTVDSPPGGPTVIRAEIPCG